MANEVLWALSAYQKKSIVMGHNGHLAFDAKNLLPVTDQQGHSDMMGSHLKKRLGNGYKNLGLFGHCLKVWDIMEGDLRAQFNQLLFIREGHPFTPAKKPSTIASP